MAKLSLGHMAPEYMMQLATAVHNRNAHAQMMHQAMNQGFLEAAVHHDDQASNAGAQAYGATAHIAPAEQLNNRTSIFHQASQAHKFMEQ